MRRLFGISRRSLEKTRKSHSKASVGDDGTKYIVLCKKKSQGSEIVRSTLQGRVCE